MKHIVLYTDASLKAGKFAGAAVYQPQLHSSFRCRLYEKKDINRAELGAIFIGALLNNDKNKEKIILTDSQTSIDCFLSQRSTRKYKLLVDCIRHIGHTRLKKVKAHRGIYGNEMADKLAKMAVAENDEFFLLPDDLYTSKVRPEEALYYYSSILAKMSVTNL
jgi:ribonuclease HI